MTRKIPLALLMFGVLSAQIPEMLFEDGNRAMGDGTSGQTITLHTLRNFDLERDEGTISLSNPYDGSNNFMNLTINASATGLMLLEDGIGTANAGYSGNTSLEGSFKFEILSSFDNQTPKFVQT